MGKGEFMTKEKENTKPCLNKDEKGSPEDVTVNRRYKDNLFRFIFNDKKKLLGLYNALNHSNYEDPEELEINTLENVVFLNMKNDLSFVFNLGLYIFEHQSTYCPNMPLRDLHYISTLLEGMTQKKKIYSTKLVKFPTPHFVVFYNGEEEKEERKVLHLSDAFEQPEEDPELELKVTMININYGKNKELMDACKDLRDYAFYVQKVRDYAKIMDIEAAVDKAIEECIKNDVLTDILTKFKAEVKMVSLTEYDKELHEQTLKEESWEDGWEEGWESGKLETLLNIVRKKMEKGKSIEVIAEELETEKDKIERIYEVIKSATPDSTQEELLKILLS